MNILKSFFKTNDNSSDNENKKNIISATKKDICPNCGEKLEKRPSRKKKCPHCDLFIYIRKPYLMTEEEAQLTDWAKRLERIGISREDINQHQVNLAKQFGFHPPVNDVIWRALNSIVTSNRDKNDIQNAFQEMANIARMENKDPTPYLKEAAILELQEIKQSGFADYVTVMTVNDHLVCEKCRELEGKKIPINEALNNLPIPTECQNEDGCRCWYAPVFD